MLWHGHCIAGVHGAAEDGGWSAAAPGEEEHRHRVGAGAHGADPAGGVFGRIAQIMRERCLGAWLRSCGRGVEVAQIM